MEENNDLDTEFRIRLPSVLATKIAETAKKERRSRNLQYVHMLESWYILKENLETRIESLEAALVNDKADSVQP